MLIRRPHQPRPSASSSLCRWPVADIVQCGPDDSKALKISRLRDQKNHIPQVVDFIDLTELARRAGLELGGSLEVFDLAHPARQWVPSGENLGPPTSSIIPPAERAHAPMLCDEIDNVRTIEAFVMASSRCVLWHPKNQPPPSGALTWSMTAFVREASSPHCGYSRDTAMALIMAGRIPQSRRVRGRLMDRSPFSTAPAP
jgi:hypothetical protein